MVVVMDEREPRPLCLRLCVDGGGKESLIEPLDQNRPRAPLSFLLNSFSQGKITQNQPNQLVE
ncbi:hypothetical protein M413DRAFT_448711 [Hebeloma cylindrosporum]|uniref:Uncharacterized protein n=1 Tax=Hebeloma cylindrosporum TaxID=76867 RepID=A0A0C2Y886_HEBCY|nr:hypothetical protein M413DRAFT_448711 [Hebeloma cylindrosporum h7]